MQYLVSQSPPSMPSASALSIAPPVTSRGWWLPRNSPHPQINCYQLLLKQREGGWKGVMDQA